MKSRFKITYLALTFIMAANIKAAGAGGAGGTGIDEYPPLVRAARAGDLETVISSLAAGEAHDQEQLDQAFLYAAGEGHTHILGALRGAGANINVQNTHTPLIDATMGGQVDTVRWLLDAGADTIVMDVFGRTAAVHAARGKSPDMIRLFLERAHDSICSKIVEAVAAGRIENVRMLLTAGANPDTRDERDWTGLLAAAAAPALGTDMIRLFLDAGATVDATDRTGRTALMHLANSPGMGAGWRVQLDAARLLLEAGASSTIRDTEYRMSAFDLAGHSSNLNRPMQALFKSFLPWGRRKAVAMSCYYDLWIE